MNDKKFQHLTDQQLLEAFYETGNTRLLGVLLQRYTLLLLGVCMKYLKNEEAAKDAVQQIFFKVISELKKYKVQYFKSWLYMIAKNHCLMQLRNKNYNVVGNLDENIIQEEESNLQRQAEKEKLLSLLEAAMQQLHTEQRTCINLFYLEKKSYQQISEQTGFNLLQVKSFIQNGKRNLKLLVEKKDETGIMEDLLNIWNADDELNEEELMNYVKGKSSVDEQHAVEKQMADSTFINDAVEGLKNFSSTDTVNTYVQKINEELHKHLHNKKYKRKKAVFNQSWEIVAVITIILLCILAFVIIEMIKK